jgi:hypothetical protein
MAQGGRHFEDPIVSPDNGVHRILPDVGPELHRVRRHQVGELATQDVLKSGIVIDPLGIEQLSARNTPLQKDRPQHPASGVHGGAQPRGSSTHNDDVQLRAPVHTFSNERSRNPYPTKI